MTGYPWSSGDALLADDLNAALDPRALAEAIQRIYLGTLSITEPYTNQIFQRDTRTGGLYTKGIGEILLTINPSDPVTILEHRLRDAATPATVVQDWSSSVPPLSPGSQVVGLTAPAGLHKYLVDIRANHDDTSVKSTTHAVMMGEIIGFAGQSLAEDMVSNAASGDPATIASLGLTISPWAYIFAGYASNSGAYPPVADGADVNYPPNTFLASSNSGTFRSTFAVEYLNRLIALAGVPCGMVGYAVGGTGIDSWLPGYTGPNPGHWDKLVNVLTLAGGKFSTFIWDQGHYETKNGNTASNYLQQLTLLESNVDMAFPNADYASIVATIPGIGSYGSGPSFIEMVRNTAKQYAATVALTDYVDGYDATLWTDLVHPSQVGNIPYADHFYRATAQRWGLLTHGDKGPAITSGARAYGNLNIVLTVAQTNGGTAWVAVGAPATQFQVFVAGTTTTPVALDGTTPVDLSDPSRITLKLASAPTEPQPFDVWYRRPPDTSGIVAAGIYDNVTDADGLTVGRQLWDTAAPVTIASPVITITITTTIADTTPSAALTVSGTYSPAPPVSLDYSFDGGTVWSAAAGATIGSGVWSFNVNVPAQPGLYKLRVRDHITFGTGLSNPFLVALVSPPVLPTLSNPIFAFDAYAARGALYTDTAMSQQAAIGDTVQGLTDASGNNNNFTQTSSVLAPKLIGNVKNSLPGLRFAGSLQQFLLQNGGTISATLKGSGGYVVLAIFTAATLPTAPSQECVAFGAAAATAARKVRIHQLVSGTVRGSRNGDSALNNVASPSPVGANAIVKAVHRWDGASIKLAANALAEATTAVTGAFTLAWTEGSMIGAANDTPTDSYLDGWVHEIRVWNVAASDAERTSLLTYATAKWG